MKCNVQNLVQYTLIELLEGIKYIIACIVSVLINILAIKLSLQCFHIDEIGQVILMQINFSRVSK